MRTRVPWHPRRQRRKEKEKKRSKKEKREKKSKKKRKREKAPVERCADTYAHDWASVLYLPATSFLRTVRTEGAGQLVRHGTYAARVPTSGVPCVPPTVAPQVERSIITGKRIQRKEGSVADQAGEAPLVVATISTHGARVAHAVSLGRGGGRGVRVATLRV